MAIPITSGLVYLVQGVREYFEANDVTAKVALGWKERARQAQGPGGANRVVIQPCDDQGKSGALTMNLKGAGYRGVLNDEGTDRIGSARVLRGWERQVLVNVWAVDPERPNDEDATIEQIEALFEWTVRAVQYVAQATAVWGAVTYTMDPKELTHGRELRAVLTLNQPIFDKPLELKKPVTPVIIPKLDGEIDDE